MNERDPLSTHHHSSESAVGIDFVPQRDFTGDAWPSAVATVDRPLTIADMTDRLDGWQEFELMPPRYRDRCHATGSLQKWSIALLCSASITIGSLIVFWMRGRHSIESHAMLIADASPIGEIRSKTEWMEYENVLLDQWCSWVESAAPDDSMVQVLTATALATHPVTDATKQDHLDIQSVDIKLPLEHHSLGIETPTWAQPRFTLTALALNRDVLMPWNERLEASGRLRDVKLTTPSGAWREALIQISATPLSEKVLP